MAKAKPADCDCEYPSTIFRSGTGHDPGCPAHKRLWPVLLGKMAHKPENEQDYDRGRFGETVLHMEAVVQELLVWVEHTQGEGVTLEAVRALQRHVGMMKRNLGLE